jgi:hypothetical protein
MLPGDEIRWEIRFEWLDGHRLLIQRSHHEHPDIPVAIAVFGVISGQLSVHYHDSPRGPPNLHAQLRRRGIAPGTLVLPTSRSA